MDELAITKFFKALETEDEKEAKKLCKDVLEECKILDNFPDLNASAKPHIKGVAQLTENVTKGQMHIARPKWRAAKARFSAHLQNKLQEYKQKSAAKHSDKTYSKEPRPDYENPTNNYANNYRQQDTYDHDSRGEVKSSDMSTPQRNSTYPDRRKPAFSVDEETDKMKKSQRASQAMRHNNPDIADLSDINRPTKIAERFSEFYDNEWTECFEILCNKKKTEEKTIAHLLLQIVQEAYAFCKEEAEQEIVAMHSAIIDILEFGETKGKKNKNTPLDASLLVQYRKEIASKAVGRIQKEFIEKKLKTICSQFVKGSTPSDVGVMARFGRRAVELTWWMCVQDPPVHMVSTDEDSFNPDFYKAYTKSGKTLDYFVWPALKLYKTGGIMTKGVVQYR